MTTLITALLASLGLLAQPAPKCVQPPTPAPEVAPMPKPAPEMAPMPKPAPTPDVAPVPKPASDDAGGVSQETTDAPSRTAGPFSSYLDAADYADYLEIELGYYTRVVLSGNGWYYVIFW